MSSSSFSISEPDGLAPLVMRFLNQVAWNLGVPLLELLWDSGATTALEVTPARKRYATLLADMISVFACLNCNKPNGHQNTVNFPKQILNPRFRGGSRKATMNQNMEIRNR